MIAPARDELFAGGRVIPATLNGKPIRVIATGLDPRRHHRHGLLAEERARRMFLPASTRFLEAGGMFYRDGSGALGLCYVAAGRLVGFFEPVINSWDCLGAHGRVEGAGVRASDFLCQ